METEFLTADQAALYVNSKYEFLTTKTLAKLACQGGGPTFRVLGKKRYYTRDDLEKWVVSQMSEPVTSHTQLKSSRAK